MSVLAIDPGPTESAWLLWNGERVVAASIDPNDRVLQVVEQHRPSPLAPVDRRAHLAIESVESFGMAVGREVFDTVFWSGRFCQVWGTTFTRLGRKEIKLHLCGTCRAKDPNVRQALLDRFGGKAAVGTKKQPGPLYSIKSHLWSALAVAVAFSDIYAPKR